MAAAMGTLSREEEIRWHRNDVRRNLRERHRAKLQQTNWAMRKFREQKDPDEAGESWKYDRVPLRELSTGEDGDHPSPFYPGIPSEAWLRSIVGESYGPPGIGQRLDDPHALHSQREVRAWNRLQDIKQFFTTGGATPGRNIRWVFQRLLGFGGCGIVTHFRVHDDDANTEQDVAIKADLSSWEDEGLVGEGEMMKNFTRSKHIVQTVPREPIGKPPSRKRIPHDWAHWKHDDSSSEEESSGDEDTPAMEPASRKKRKPRHQQSSQEREKKRARWDPPPPVGLVRPQALAEDNAREPRKNYVVIEYLPAGDLKNLIAKVRNDNGFFPNSVLWQLFRCLLKQCIGLAYPVRKFHPDRMTTEGDLEEMIPPEEQKWRKRRFVHFDFDPFNIFIGDLDPESDDHRLSPILKLADFGLAEEIKEWKRDCYYLGRRRLGKFNFRAPEQFGDEWEFIDDDHDGMQLAEQEVAGNYGSAMNIWGAGLTMLSLVILGWPPQPPVPGDLPLYDETKDFPSYGNILLDGRWDHIDDRLRALISLCLAHNPNNRPTLEELEKYINAGINSAVHDDDLPDPHEWLEQKLFGAPLDPVYFSLAGPGED